MVKVIIRDADGDGDADEPVRTRSQRRIVGRRNNLGTVEKPDSPVKGAEMIAMLPKSSSQSKACLDAVEVCKEEKV